MRSLHRVADVRDMPLPKRDEDKAAVNALLSMPASCGFVILDDGIPIWWGTWGTYRWVPVLLSHATASFDASAHDGHFRLLADIREDYGSWGDNFFHAFCDRHGLDPDAGRPVSSNYPELIVPLARAARLALSRCDRRLHEFLATSLDLLTDDGVASGREIRLCRRYARELGPQPSHRPGIDGDTLAEVAATVLALTPGQCRFSDSEAWVETMDANGQAEKLWLRLHGLGAVVDTDGVLPLPLLPCLDQDDLLRRKIELELIAMGWRLVPRNHAPITARRLGIKSLFERVRRPWT